MLAGSLASRASVKSAAFEIVTGLGRSLPFTGLLFLLGGLALIGIPPLNGFISKLMLFRGGVEAGQYLPLLVAGAASVITLIYVSRAFQRIWWAPPAAGATARPYGDSLVAPTLLIALCLALGLWAEPLVSVACTTGLWLSDPANYIRAVLGV
jgi:multicomponent Na+:H+ antiporter subunit D